MNQPMQQRDDGLWEAAVPLPYFLLFGRKQCGHPTSSRDSGRCGRTFWRRAAYETHYRIEHTDGKVYRR